MAFDASGRFIGFSQTLKLIALFRFINVNYGAVLGTFLETSGDNLEPKNIMSKDSIILNQTGLKGRLSTYNKSITTFELFHYKIILYMLSFLLKIVGNYIVYKIKATGKINNKLFYVIYFHNKVHFILFNLYLSGCVFLNARSVLHMKYLPNTLYQIFDKYLNILCFLFYWWDIMDMIYTSLVSLVTDPVNNIEPKKTPEYLKVVEVKEIIQKDLLEKKKNTNTFDVSAL